jgi:quercetin dioxygenase-like cupin family protein
MRFPTSLAVLAIGACALGSAYAQTPPHPHVMQSVTEAKWEPAPPFLPPGAQLAVLSGNPMAAGDSYSVRLKFPAGYDIPAHSHPTDENVVVVSGAVFMALGDKLDRQAGRSVGPGGYFVAPAGMNHYAYTKEPTTIVLYGIGPVEFKYVNPADDPRNGKIASK